VRSEPHTVPLLKHGEPLTLVMIDEPGLTLKNARGVAEGVVDWFTHAMSTMLVVHRSKDVAWTVVKEVVVHLKKMNKESKTVGGKAQMYGWQEELFMYEYPWCMDSVKTGAPAPPSGDKAEKELFRAGMDWVAVLHIKMGEKGGEIQCAVDATRAPPQDAATFRIAEGNAARLLVGQQPATSSLAAFTNKVLLTGSAPVAVPAHFADYRTRTAVQSLPRSNRVSKR
jgi:hypothetical protein